MEWVLCPLCLHTVPPLPPSPPPPPPPPTHTHTPPWPIARPMGKTDEMCTIVVTSKTFIVGALTELDYFYFCFSRHSNPQVSYRRSVSSSSGLWQLAILCWFRTFIRRQGKMLNHHRHRNHRHHPSSSSLSWSSSSTSPHLIFAPFILLTSFSASSVSHSSATYVCYLFTISIGAVSLLSASVVIFSLRGNLAQEDKASAKYSVRYSTQQQNPNQQATARPRPQARRQVLLPSDLRLGF